MIALLFSCFLGFFLIVVESFDAGFFQDMKIDVALANFVPIYVLEHHAA